MWTRGGPAQVAAVATAAATHFANASNLAMHGPAIKMAKYLETIRQTPTQVQAVQSIEC